MALESVRAALQILSGAGELTRAKATEAAQTLLSVTGLEKPVGRAGAVASQVSSLADELLEAAAANRELIRETVQAEIAGQL